MISYDPKVTSVPALIKVVENTPSVMGSSVKFRAAVHKGAASHTRKQT